MQGEGLPSPLTPVHEAQKYNIRVIPGGGKSPSY